MPGNGNGRAEPVDVHDDTPPNGTPAPREVESFERAIAREEFDLVGRVVLAEKATLQLSTDSAGRYKSLTEHQQATHDAVKALGRKVDLHVRHATAAVRTLADEVHGLRSDFAGLSTFLGSLSTSHRARLDTLGEIVVEQKSQIGALAKRWGWVAVAIAAAYPIRVLWDLAGSVAPHLIPSIPKGLP